jgi:glycosyltransferase involved in cell wall biosynthesis
MKLLWVKNDFLHPTTKGGHIRTLEMLKRLHARHEIHYVALENPGSPEGVARSREYAARAYPVRHHVPSKRSLAFAGQLAAGLFDPMPVAVSRFRSRAMRAEVGRLLARGAFDRAVCDFLMAAPYFPDLSRALLFEHNVEYMIWRRRTERAANPIARAYLALQARRMYAYEREACRAAGFVATVSPVDSAIIEREFGVASADVPTGVDTAYFARPEGFASDPKFASDLVFVGSMDWMPNQEGVLWFLGEILPRIRARRPLARVAIVGRDPSPNLVKAVHETATVHVTGSVNDVRPYLWHSAVSIVPLRVGSGTRLKIYEAMAAGTATVSTPIGAEGLPVEHGRHLLLAADAESFAAACLELLENEPRRRELAASAQAFVRENFSWESVARRFEEILEGAPRAS